MLKRVVIGGVVLEIKIREMADGRFSAQYLNENKGEGYKGWKYRDPLHGVEQYGKTAIEAELKLRDLIVNLRQHQVKTNVTLYL